MKKRTLHIILIIALICALLLPSMASGSAIISAGSSSLTEFVSDAKSMLDYTDAFSSAGTMQDFYNLAQNPNFQLDAANFINSYNTLKSERWILNNLAASASSASSSSFGRNAWVLAYYINQLNSANTLSEFAAIIMDENFLQSVEDFIASYYVLESEIYGYANNGTPSGFSPAYNYRTGVSATLTMKMATRLGPGTAYSEELGTFPQSTVIRVIEQVMGNDVSWALVDFESGGARYRAYTGMKRISTAQSVPWGNADPAGAVTLQQIEAYYGPGYYYARHKLNVPANTQLFVYGVENGFLICDFQRDGELIRAYIPSDSRVR